MNARRPKKLSKKLERSIRAMYRRMLKAEDRASQQYDLADRLSLKIAEKAKGNLVPISDLKAIRAIDQMKAAIDHPKREPGQMPKAWAHAAVRQFKIEEVKIAAEISA